VIHDNRRICGLATVTGLDKIRGRIVHDKRRVTLLRHINCMAVEIAILKGQGLTLVILTDFIVGIINISVFVVLLLDIADERILRIGMLYTPGKVPGNRMSVFNTSLGKFRGWSGLIVGQCRGRAKSRTHRYKNTAC